MKALGIAALVLGLTVGAAAHLQASEKVVFGLDWQVLGRHAGYIVAHERGFYREELTRDIITEAYGLKVAVPVEDLSA